MLLERSDLAATQNVPVEEGPRTRPRTKVFRRGSTISLAGGFEQTSTIGESALSIAVIFYRSNLPLHVVDHTGKPPRITQKTHYK